MKSFLSLSILCLALACNSRTTKDENQTSQVSDSLNEKKQQADMGQSIDWSGTWTFTDNAPIDYTLTIGNKEQEMYVCTFKAEGVQTNYELDCLGLAKENAFELYYQGVSAGAFLMADKINRDKPALTLKRVEGKIVTYWDQLINNFVEQGNHSGSVCFER